MAHRTLREWTLLPIGTKVGEIPQQEAESLLCAVERTGFAPNTVLERRHNAIYARQTVGIIATPDSTLEILPKIDGLDGDDGGCRRQLVNMLEVAFDLPIKAGDASHLDWQSGTWLEILIGLFIRQLRHALQSGMPRRYLAFEDDLPRMRGRLDVTRQFTKRLAAADKIACQFDDLSSDIMLNRVIKATIEQALRFAQSHENRRRLNEIKLGYADVTSMSVNDLCFDIVLDRTNERWRNLLAWARLLLGKQFQTTSSGKNQGVALLFEMNTLFERYVARLFERTLKGTDCSVPIQGGLRFCLKTLDPQFRGVFQTRPDIMVKKDERTILVIDTKWKRIKPESIDKKHGVSQGDIYQMMAYARIYNCRHVVLLYPHHAEIGMAEGIVKHYKIQGGEGDVLTLATLGLSGGQRKTAESLKQLASAFFDGTSSQETLSCIPIPTAPHVQRPASSD